MIWRSSNRIIVRCRRTYFLFPVHSFFSLDSKCSSYSPQHPYISWWGYFCCCWWWSSSTLMMSWVPLSGVSSSGIWLSLSSFIQHNNTSRDKIITDSKRLIFLLSVATGAAVKYLYHHQHEKSRESLTKWKIIKDPNEKKGRRQEESLSFLSLLYPSSSNFYLSPFTTSGYKTSRGEGMKRKISRC